jgi:AraC-like DNA-binding protein
MQRVGINRSISGAHMHQWILFVSPACFGVGNAPPVRLTSPHWVCIEPHVPCVFGDDTHPYTHSWIQCHGRLIPHLIAASRIPLNTALPVCSGDGIESYILAVYREMSGHAEPDPVVVGNLLECLLREASRQSALSTSVFVPHGLLAVRNYIEQEYHRPLSLAALAERAGLSTAYFGAQFKQHFGISPIEWVIGLRLSEAKTLLADMNLSVADIACRVGYDDLCYFSKLFKKRIGLGPREYRNAIHEGARRDV